MGEQETSLPRAILPPFLTVHLLFEVDRQVHPIHDSSAAKRSNPYKSSRRQAHQVSLSPAVFQLPGNPAVTPMLRSNRMKISDAYSTTLPLWLIRFIADSCFIPVPPGTTPEVPTLA